jgi:hypothetical protein
MEETLEAIATLAPHVPPEQAVDDERLELLAEELREAIRRKVTPAA